MATSESDNSFIKFLHHFNLIASRWLISHTLRNCDGIVYVERQLRWYQLATLSNFIKLCATQDITLFLQVLEVPCKVKEGSAGGLLILKAL
jgi:hypothetical protein